MMCPRRPRRSPIPLFGRTKAGYPFGLKMPERTEVSGVERAKESFTGKELDAETSWMYFGARFYDAAIGRFLSVDRMGHKYPSLNPYHYVFNNPLRFTDVTGDTVDIDPALMQTVKTHDEEGNALELTDEQLQALNFQRWLASSDGKTFMSDFGAGGKFGESLVNFKLSTIPGKTGIAGFFQNKESLSNFFGSTTYGERGMDEAYFSRSDSPTTIEGGRKNLVMNVYFNPNIARNSDYTANHEPGHVYFGADYVSRNLPIPTLQHYLPQPKSMPYEWWNH